MVTNPEKLDSGLDSELLDIQKDTKNWLTALKKMIGFEKKSDSGTTEVKEDNGTKTEVFEYKGAIGFNYNQESGGKRQILTRKEGNTYKVRVKKWAQFPNGEDWQTQKFDGKETFDFEASNRKQFNVELGKALDKIIEDRQRLPKTGKTVYDMLNKENEQSQPNGNENKIESTVTRDTQYEKDFGVTLLRDGDLKFYVVKKDEGLGVIRQKLSKIPEFSYLAGSDYSVPNSGRNIHAFNTPNSSLVPGFYLPIPLKREEREVSDGDFKGYAKKALEEMQDDANYGQKIKGLLKTYKKDDLVNMMAAWAKSESGEDNDPSAPIGSTELHRWEKNYRAYSFSYFHILMEKTADRKHDGPGLRARKKLGLTEGDCYKPQNACKLFLGYCFEKCKDFHLSDDYFFNVTSLKQAQKVGTVYNGGIKGYGDKLRRNVEYYKGIK